MTAGPHDLIKHTQANGLGTHLKLARCTRMQHGLGKGAGPPQWGQNHVWSTKHCPGCAELLLLPAGSLAASA